MFNQDDFNAFFSQKDKHCRIDFPKKCGYSLLQNIQISKDIKLMKNSTCSMDEFCVQHNYAKSNGLYLSFLIDGNVEIKSIKEKNPMLMMKNKSLFLHNEAINGMTSLKPNSYFKSLNILISQNFLDKYLPNISFHEVKHLHVNPKIQALAQEIYKSPFNGSLEELQIQSKTLDLIRLELLKLSLPEIKQKIMLTPYDTQALQKAKILLENEYKNPPSIEELSKKIRLNEFKLKNGFKSLFGIAPYTFSLKIRMQKAQELLKTGEYNVTEVAKEVGFPYVQNFTKAFIKEFGLRPKDVLKRSQIYI